MKNNSFIIKPSLAAYGGFSIGKWKDKVVLIKGAIPGEEVEASIENEKSDYFIAKTLKVIKQSPDRITPECEYFGVCGGCHYQYISYARQVRLKEEILQDCIKRIAKIETQVSDSIFHEIPWGYRYRGQFKVVDKKIGFYREKTRDIVDIKRCPLMVNEINNCLDAIHDAFLTRGNDLLQHISDIHIACGDVIAFLITAKDMKIDLKRLAESLPDMISLSIFCNGKIFSLHGRDYITLNLNGLKYTVSPMSFFQSHWRLNKVVVDFVKKSLQPLEDKKILDLYSGAGNFSIPLAQISKEVIAIEENPYAVIDGKRNIKINQIKNCEFICIPVENAHIQKADIIVVDPPRSGLTNKTVEKLLNSSAEKIVYISCNPSTLARDIKKLIKKYEIESLRMIDFFPQTYHIEAICFLSLR